MAAATACTRVSSRRRLRKPRRHRSRRRSCVPSRRWGSVSRHSSRRTAGCAASDCSEHGQAIPLEIVMDETVADRDIKSTLWSKKVCPSCGLYVRTCVSGPPWPRFLCA